MWHQNHLPSILERVDQNNIMVKTCPLKIKAKIMKVCKNIDFLWSLILEMAHFSLMLFMGKLKLWSHLHSSGKGGGGCSNYFLKGCAVQGYFSLQKCLIWCFFSPKNFFAHGDPFLRLCLPASKTADFTIFFRNFGEMGPSSKWFV